MRKVTIIGAGPGNPDLLSRAALDAIDIADVVIGAHRALVGIDVPPDVVRCELVKTADIVAALTDAASWRRAVVVMTGDVGLFSGARRLVEALSSDAQVDVRVIPGISSASYLAARLARPWQDWRFASAHGVACDIVAEAERAGELFLVTSGGEDPSRLSGELVQAGFGDARVTVAERLSYPDERITCATASEITGQTFDDLNVMLVEFADGAGSPAGSSAASEAPAGASAPAAASSAADSAGASRAAISRWPYASSGIPDELFIRGDVPMTKQEVRAVALAKLRLTATDTVWDVGAGTGSVSIEAALVARAGSVWAVERNAAGVRLTRENADAFGCGNVHAVPGVAPEALAKLPVPDAVFVGGSAGELPSIVEAALEKNSQVRLCVPCVTVETLTEACALLSGSRFKGFEACQVSDRPRRGCRLAPSYEGAKPRVPRQRAWCRRGRRRPVSTSIPRFMVAAPSSGSGKTVVTCALLRALARRGLACAAFKCGPDYIDPLFHRRVVGARSGNLDGFFTDAPTLRALLARGAAGADVAVLEGVMGFYDGLAPGVADASSYQVARDTETPVVLVVNGRGASLSLAAVIRGIAEFLPCANVRGVVLNKTSAAACAYAAPAIEKHTGVAVLGNIPADEAFSLESRHLGLVTADEVEQLSARIDKMAELVEKSVDVDRLLEIAATAPDIREEPYRLEPIAGARPIIVVARDEAFSFYYEENLRALEDLGCELAFFSPLCDSELPRGTSALYLGGGYPELHARQLSENAPMREAVRRAVESGMPTVAECGGFLYLQREIADSEGRRWPVAGALEGASENGGRLSHFGYVDLTSQRDGLYGPRGTRIRAHEFHYWQSTCPGGDFWAQKPRRDKGWPCMTTTPSLVAGFPHVYYPANPDVARAFASAAASFAERRRHG